MDDQEPTQTLLSDEHLPTLLQHLHGAANKWEEIATFLKLGRGSIAVIREERTDVAKKLFDAITRWLNKTTAPTVAELVEVLKHPIIGEARIAQKVEREFYSQSSSELTVRANDLCK